jgi:hypothetical protein
MTEKAKTAGVGIGAFGAAAVLGWDRSQRAGRAIDRGR